MNAAILNADLPISIRMKRASRRGWMLDRRDNIKFLVQGAQAYRQLAAQLAWEGTFEQNRNQPAPFSSFGQQSVDLEYEAFALKTTLDDLQSKHYPGVGNDVQKLHHAIDNLESMAAVRHEEDKMMALTKTALLKAVQAAKTRQIVGFENLPLLAQMRSATFVSKGRSGEAIGRDFELGRGRGCATGAKCPCTGAATAIEAQDAIAKPTKPSLTTNIYLFPSRTRLRCRLSRRVRPAAHRQASRRGQGSTAMGP